MLNDRRYFRYKLLEKEKHARPISSYDNGRSVMGECVAEINGMVSV